MTDKPDTSTEAVEKLACELPYGADATLIAAAPDILEALKMVASKIKPGDDLPDDTFADFSGEETEMIFNAISKAT